MPDLPFQYSTRMQLYVPPLDEDVALAMEQRDVEIEDYLARLAARGLYRYAASTTERDAIPASDLSVGTTVIVGTAAGTGTQMPRTYQWTGAGWQFIGWWAPAGRAGVALTDAAQLINSGTTTDITWGTEVQDLDGWTSGGSTTLTVPTGWDGLYSVSNRSLWGTGVLGASPAAYGYVNGSLLYGVGGLIAGGVFTLAYDRVFAAGDTIKFAVFQNSGVAVNVLHALQITWLGP